MLYSHINPEQLDKRLLSALRYAVDPFFLPKTWQLAVLTAPTLPGKWVRRVR